MKTFGEHLYESGYRNSIARYRVGGIQTRRFNPAIPLASPYIIGKDGRAYENPEWRTSIKGRYDFLLDEISGFAGERVPDKATEIIPFAKKVLGESWQPFDIGVSDNWHPIDEAWYDLAYVSNGLLMAVQGLMLPQSQSENNEVEDLRRKIAILERNVQDGLQYANKMKSTLVAVVSNITSSVPTSPGGGKYVGKLKEIRSTLESLL